LVRAYGKKSEVIIDRKQEIMVSALAGLWSAGVSWSLIGLERVYLSCLVIMLNIV
jgi:hypothetical protein